MIGKEDIMVMRVSQEEFLLRMKWNERNLWNPGILNDEQNWMEKSFADVRIPMSMSMRHGAIISVRALPSYF